jgi:hypothetical protein
MSHVRVQRGLWERAAEPWGPRDHMSRVQRAAGPVGAMGGPGSHDPRPGESGITRPEVRRCRRTQRAPQKRGHNEAVAFQDFSLVFFFFFYLIKEVSLFEFSRN